MPEDLPFATKPWLAEEMIVAALDAGVTASWVTGDEAYGQDPQLRACLERIGIGYVMAVACSTRVRINQGRTPVRADVLADRLPASAWQRHSAGTGVAEGGGWSCGQPFFVLVAVVHGHVNAVLAGDTQETLSPGELRPPGESRLNR